MAKTCGAFGGRTAAGRKCRRPRATTPCPGHEPEPTPEVTTCGELGGLNKAGKPCGRKRYDGQPCMEHRDPPSPTAPQITREGNQQRFLDALASGPTDVTGAALDAGVSRDVVYDWLRDDPTFRPRFVEAKQHGNERLRAELRLRGVQGWDEEETVTTHDPDGKVVATRTKVRRRKSDRVLLRLAEAHLPEFRRRLDVKLVEREVGAMTDQELAAELERLAQKAREVEDLELEG